MGPFDCVARLLVHEHARVSPLKRATHYGRAGKHRLRLQGGGHAKWPLRECCRGGNHASSAEKICHCTRSARDGVHLPTASSGLATIAETGLAIALPPAALCSSPTPPVLSSAAVIYLLSCLALPLSPPAALLLLPSLLGASSHGVRCSPRQHTAAQNSPFPWHQGHKIRATHLMLDVILCEGIVSNTLS